MSFTWPTLWASVLLLFWAQCPSAVSFTLTGHGDVPRPRRPPPVLFIATMSTHPADDQDHRAVPARPTNLYIDRRGGLAAGTGMFASSWLLTAPSTSTTPAVVHAATTLQPPSQASLKPTGLCDDAISHLRNPKTGQDIYMIGTAHISNASALLVRSTIRELRPQTVMLELDASRIGRLAKNTSNSIPKPSSMGTSEPSRRVAIVASSSSDSPDVPPATFVIPGPASTALQPPPSDPGFLSKQEEGKAGFLRAALGELTRVGSGFRERLVGLGAMVVGQVISGLYRGLDKMGFVSGQEFIVAIDEGRKVGADLLLGDQDVQVTLRRLSDALSRSELGKVREMESPSRSPAARELEARGIRMGDNAADISVAMEALKERSSVRTLMASLQQELPEVYKAMIEERDAYMTASLLGCGSQTIVGVVGIGHLDGIERNLGREGFVRVPCRPEPVRR